MKKAKRLSDVSIDELSLIFREHKGSQWAPRNDEARLLAVKAGEAGASQDPVKPASWLNALVDLAKKAAGFPVSSDVPDGVDGDDDGADDYNAIVGQVCSLYYDLSSAMGIADNDARSFAIKYAIDNFLRCLDDVRGGGDGSVEKAGKRHSAADQAHIDAIGDAHGKLQKAVNAAQAAADAVKEHLDGLAPQQADDNDDESNAVGDESDDASKAAEIEATETEDVEKAEPKPYGDVKYADPKNGKYPIDTEEHARAAWSYINMPKNAEKYSADELASVKSKIRAACKKFGIEVSDDSKAAPTSEAESNQEVEMTEDQVKALVAEALAAKAAEDQAKIDAANEAAEKAKAEAEAAKADAKAAAAKAKAETEAREKAEAELNAAARKPTGKGSAAGERPGESSLVRALKAANAGTPLTAQGRE